MRFNISKQNVFIASHSNALDLRQASWIRRHRSAPQILREIVPTASKIAVLANPGNPIHRLIIAEELPQTAQQLGVALPIVEATTAEELDIAFASAATQHADAIVVFGDTLTFRYATQVTALAAKHRLPAIYLSRLFRHQWRIDFIRPRFCRFVFSCRRLRG